MFDEVSYFKNEKGFKNVSVISNVIYFIEMIKVEINVKNRNKHKPFQYW